MSAVNDKSEDFALLSGKSDIFSGVTVDPKLLAETTELFEKQLEKSLEAWRSEKKRGIWLSIPSHRTVLIPIAQKLGFTLHHAREDYVMLTHWLDETEKIQLPSYAMATIGVGGLVVNKNRQVLLVKERFSHIKDYFKLPGGCLDLGESIEQGVAREVFEETGIRAQIRGVLSFTYKTNFRFGHSDLYVICLMSLPENDEDQQIKFDPLEIAECIWMPLDEWANSPEKHPIPVTLEVSRLAVKVLDGQESLLEAKNYEIKIRPEGPTWDFTMFRKKIE